jgi:EpsI family protein
MSYSTPRFLLAALLIAGPAIILQIRPPEIHPSRLPLQNFPEQIGSSTGIWTGTDVAIDKDVLDVLGPGDFLLRNYENPEQNQPSLNLFIAYFPSQRAGDTIHSPAHCLPGAGWTPVENTRTTLTVPGHAPFPANRYVLSKRDSRMFVLYWYWAHDRGVASEYWAKYYLVADSIKMNRSDGSLVRITTAMEPGETPAAAERRLQPFISNVVPMLNDYIPR